MVKELDDLRNYTKNLSESKLDQLWKALRYEKYSAEQIVFTKGDLPHKFYIILEGYVNMWFPKNLDMY